MKAHVLSIGQCTADDARLARMLGVEADAHLDRASTGDDARRAMAEHAYDLILVNRVLEMDGASGADLIGQLRKEGVSAPMMLVSDYADAQVAAIANGATKGFGKSTLGGPEVGQLMRQVLQSAPKVGIG